MAKRELAAITVLTVAALLLGACGKTHESLANEGADKMTKMVSILKGVTDAASAKAAAPQIDAVVKEMKDLKAEDDKLPKMTQADADALKAKIKPKFDAAEKDLTAEMERIGKASPEAMMEVMKPLSGMADMGN